MLHPCGTPRAALGVPVVWWHRRLLDVGAPDFAAAAPNGGTDAEATIVPARLI